jgi:hypothetical protein
VHELETELGLTVLGGGDPVGRIRASI